MYREDGQNKKHKKEQDEQRHEIAVRAIRGNNPLLLRVVFTPVLPTHTSTRQRYYKKAIKTI